jgi:uncharacterized membrane protein
MNKNLRLFSFILAGIGLVDSIYLSWVDLTHTQAYCGGSGDCQTVANSPYSEIAGIPIALFGMLGYLAIIALLFLETRYKYFTQYSPIMIFGITLAGTIYSAYLTYLEIAVINAICPYCVVSAIVMTLLFVISIVRFVYQDTETHPIRS